MKIKKYAKKLQLTKATITNLDGKDMNQAARGGGDTDFTDCYQYTCYGTCYVSCSCQQPCPY